MTDTVQENVLELVSFIFYEAASADTPFIAFFGEPSTNFATDVRLSG